VAIGDPGGNLGHEDPQVPLQGHQHLVQLRPRRGLAAGQAQDGLGLVHRPVDLDGRVVLADPPTEEQARGPVVALLGVDLHAAITRVRIYW
jgi:hypothetical protein